MMVVFVEEFGVSGLTVSEIKADTMCIPIPRAPTTKITFNAKWQVNPFHLDARHGPILRATTTSYVLHITGCCLES